MSLRVRARESEGVCADGASSSYRINSICHVKVRLTQVNQLTLLGKGAKQSKGLWSQYIAWYAHTATKSFNSSE